MRPKALFLAATLACGVTTAQAATQITCSTGAVGDTLRVTLNGNKATIEKPPLKMTGAVKTSMSLYEINLGEGASLSINRDSGAGLWSFVGETLFYRCRLGGPLL